MTVLSVISKYNDNKYYDDDILVYTDHGQFTPVCAPTYGQYPSDPNCQIPFVYNSTFKAFQARWLLRPSARCCNALLPLRSSACSRPQHSLRILNYF